MYSDSLYQGRGREEGRRRERVRFMHIQLGEVLQREKKDLIRFVHYERITGAKGERGRMGQAVSLAPTLRKNIASKNEHRRLAPVCSVAESTQIGKKMKGKDRKVEYKQMNFTGTENTEGS